MCGCCLNLAGLRSLEAVIEEEVGRVMAVDLDELIPQNKVLGPAYRKGLEEGLLEGRQEGLLEGQQELLRQQMERRFGSLPSWVDTRLATLSSAALNDLAMRILDTPSLEQLFAEQ